MIDMRVRITAILSVATLMTSCAIGDTPEARLPLVSENQIESRLAERTPGQITTGQAEPLEHLAYRYNTVNRSYTAAVDINRDLASADPELVGPARAISQRLAEAHNLAALGRIGEAEFALTRARQALTAARLSASDRNFLSIELDLAHAAVGSQKASRLKGGERRQALEAALNHATRAAQAVTRVQSGGVQTSQATDNPLSPETTSEYNRSLRGAQSDVVGRSMSENEKLATLRAYAQFLRAAALLPLSRTDEADSANREALTLVESLPRDVQEWLRVEIWKQKSKIQLERGQLADAEQTLSEARKRLRRTVGQSRLEASLARSLTQVQLARNNTDGAKQSEAEAFDILVEQRDGRPPTREDVASYLRLLAPSAVSGNQADVARFFTVASVAIETETASTVADVATRFAAGNDATGRAIRDLQNKRRVLDRAMARQSRVQDVSANATPQQIKEAEDGVISARRDVRIAEEEALKNGGARATAVLSPSADLDQIRSVLKPGEAYVRFIFLDDGVGYAILVTKADARVTRLSITEAETGAAVDRIRASARLVEGPDGRSTLPRFQATAAHQLYKDLFGGFGPEFRSIRSLVIEPAGPLFSLPFAALLTDALSDDIYQNLVRPGGTLYANAPWMGRSTSIELSVGSAGFVRLRSSQGQQPASTASRQRLLAFADPVAPAQIDATARLIGERRSSIRAGASGSALAERCVTEASRMLSFEGLPESQAEANHALQALGASGVVVTGASFTDQDVTSRGDLDRYDNILFATHAGLPNNADCWPDPFLMTSFNGADGDGILETLEIANLNLNANLVVLSACSTAAGDSRGQALGGLAQSFIFAGSRGVMVSHWPVSSVGAGELSTAFFTLLGEGRSASEALAGAEKKLMDQPELSHPYYWAAFTLVGGVS